MKRKVLNVGCGASSNRASGWVNLDAHPYPGVQVVHDLDVIPWPFADTSFDHVQAIQVFEHVHNPVGFMTETWRVLRPGGTVWLTTPHFQSENAFTDPTHVRFCTPRSWDYWIAGRPLFNQFNPAYGGVWFSSGSVEHHGDDLRVSLVK